MILEAMKRIRELAQLVEALELRVDALEAAQHEHDAKVLKAAPSRRARSPRDAHAPPHPSGPPGQ